MVIFERETVEFGDVLNNFVGGRAAASFNACRVNRNSFAGVWVVFAQAFVKVSVEIGAAGDVGSTGNYEF